MRPKGEEHRERGDKGLSRWLIESVLPLALPTVATAVSLRFNTPLFQRRRERRPAAILLSQTATPHRHVVQARRILIFLNFGPDEPVVSHSEYTGNSYEIQTINSHTVFTTTTQSVR
jgi:hypothetical protein